MQTAIAEYHTLADASSERIKQHLATFLPFVIHSVGRECATTATPSPFCDLNTYLAEDVKDGRVQVSVAPRGEPFSGDPLNACTVEMRLEEFMLNYQEHGARSDLSLYLSQCPIVSNEPEIPPLLPQLAHLARLCVLSSMVVVLEVARAVSDMCVVRWMLHFSGQRRCCGPRTFCV